MAADQSPPSSSSPKIEPFSPYYLGPHDRPGDFITPTRLRGDNYDEWANDVQMDLQARRKFVFLNGTITAPSSPCTQDDWDTLRAMLISWLMNTINLEIKATLSRYKDAKRLWDTLRSRFSIVNGPRIQQLKSSIARCEQTKTMSIATYFGKLTALWEELNNYEPLIQCSCCNTCTAGEEHKKRRDNTRLHQFLMGLYPDNFSQTRAHILSQDPLPTIDRAYQLLVQDERVRLTTPFPEDKPPQAVGFAVRTPPGRNRSDQRSSPAGASSDQRDKSILFCSHCRESGHVISGCFALNGYPEWWPPGSSKQQSGPLGNSGPSGRGRQPPTTARGRGGSVKAHAVGCSNTGGSSHPPIEPSSSQVFSPDQWKILASFIGNTKVSDDRLTGEFDCNSWISDTRASRHITCNDSWLFDVRNVTCLVGLPNGKSVVATKEGSVYLSDNLTLKHVLFVPELCCNLISVSQIIDNLKCTVQFTPTTCVIHDQLREPIGTSITRDGLFYFEGVNPAQQILVNAVSSTLDLWHKTMGHPSETVVKLLPHVSSCKGSLNKVCDVFFRAKHSRDKFPLSDNKASRIFEKVHCVCGVHINTHLLVMQDIF